MTSDQIQYLIDFDYNESHYRRRRVFTDWPLDENDESLLIDFAFNAAMSLLKIEKQLTAKGKMSHLCIYDARGNLLANQD